MYGLTTPLPDEVEDQETRPGPSTDASLTEQILKEKVTIKPKVVSKIISKEPDDLDLESNDYKEVEGKAKFTRYCKVGKKGKIYESAMWRSNKF